jgi:PAS domain S-box-containing protein
MLVTQHNSTSFRSLRHPTELSDDLLRAIVEACSYNVAVLDESGKILFSSKAWQAFEKTNGLCSGTGEAYSYFEEYTRLAGPQANAHVSYTLKEDIQQLLIEHNKEFHRNYSCNGAIETWHFDVTRLNLPQVGFRILISLKDEAYVDDTLRTSEKSLSRLLDKTKIVVWEAELENWQLTYVSGQAVKMFGYPIQHWYEPNFIASHIHPDDEQRALSFFRKESQTADQFEFAFRMLANNGRVVWVHNVVSVTRVNGKPRSALGFMIDITEQKSAEDTLRDLSGRLITAQEEERSRVARELHDDLNQRMALLSIELEQLGQDAQKPHSLRRHCRALQRQAQEISTDLHRLSYKLHPSKLDHLGLGAAVKSLCEETSRNRQLKIEVRQKGFPAPLPGDVTLCVFRIVQEALHNCVRHSGAQAVQVVLEKSGQAIKLSVSDNGRGFDPKSCLMKKGLGFISMRERIRLIGGGIHVYSQPQRGTRIEASVPLQRDRLAESNEAARNGGVEWLDV